jgi:hypothetical protein
MGQKQKFELRHYLFPSSIFNNLNIRHVSAFKLWGARLGSA